MEKYFDLISKRKEASDNNDGVPEKKTTAFFSRLLDQHGKQKRLMITHLLLIKVWKQALLFPN